MEEGEYLQYAENYFPLFEYTDEESGRETVCNVELFCYSKERMMAWVRDYPRAPVSVSTSAPSLRAAICKEFKIAPELLILIERCFINSEKHPDARIQNPESPFYRIEFTEDGPQWQPLDAHGCADMTLQVFIGYRERKPRPSDKDISNMSPFGPEPGSET
jgi:hypothetical protein